MEVPIIIYDKKLVIKKLVIKKYDKNV